MAYRVPPGAVADAKRTSRNVLVQTDVMTYIKDSGLIGSVATWPHQHQPRDKFVARPSAYIVLGFVVIVFRSLIGLNGGWHFLSDDWA